MWSAYARSLQSHPQASNIATASVVYLLGDVAAQYIQKMETETSVLPSTAPPSQIYSGYSVPEWKIDSSRIQDVVVWSALIYTPIWVKLYSVFDRVWPESSMRHVLRKMTAATICNVPSLALFFCFCTAVPHIKNLVTSPEKESWREHALVIKDEIKVQLSRDLFPTVMTGICYWCPITVLNFRFVPQHLRPVCMSLFSVAWGCYLSLVQYKSVPEENNENEMVVNSKTT